MKKNYKFKIILILLFGFFTINLVFGNDTIPLILHPTAQDSINVSNGVQTTLTVASGLTHQFPIINTLLNSPTFGGTIVALILGLWRKRELKKLKRNGKLVD